MNHTLQHNYLFVDSPNAMAHTVFWTICMGQTICSECAISRRKIKRRENQKRTDKQTFQRDYVIYGRIYLGLLELNCHEQINSLKRLFIVFQKNLGRNLINPFFTKPENEKLWNIPDDVFNVLDSI
jgi:hypothetical protein